jgi:protein phosphatase methylesterase 1
MSDLFRSTISARLAKLPMIPDYDEDRDTVGSLPTGMGPPAMHVQFSESKSFVLPLLCRPARTPRVRSKRPPNPEFSPISASSYFAEASEVTIPSRNLNVRVYYTPPKFASGTVMICHHGAGYSALSFACFAKEVADMTSKECGLLALDARRHGEFAGVLRLTDTH